MTSSPELNNPNFFTLDQVKELFDKHISETFELAKAEYLLNATHLPQNRVEGNILTSQTGVEFRLPSDEELETMKAEREVSIQKVRDTLGIKQEVDMNLLGNIVGDIMRIKNMRNEGVDLDETINFRSWNDNAIVDFYTAVQALSGVTGETYKVWGSMYGQFDIEIDSTTDLDAVMQVGLVIDEGCVKSIQENTYLKEEVRADHTIEKLHRIYGKHETEK